MTEESAYRHDYGIMQGFLRAQIERQFMTRGFEKDNTIAGLLNWGPTISRSQCIRERGKKLFITTKITNKISQA